MTAPTQEQSLAALDGFEDEIRAAMQEWKLPGLAVAIVKDGEVIYQQGFGLRDIEQGLEVTPNTLFAIGSTSKAFTTAILAMLVDEGKLDWDTPLRQYLPDFRMQDQFATERMTPRDLVTHRSGLPRHDLSWIGASASREELFRRLPHLQPNKDLRTTWQYQNYMFMTAGLLAERITGQTWEELVRTRIFEPLGMTNSNFSVADSQQAEDFSLPYVVRDEKVKLTPFRNIDAMGPAGSINSSVADMSKWLIFQLNRGKAGEQQLISDSQFAQLHKPQMLVDSPQEFDEVQATAYAMGWLTEIFRGHAISHHSGGIDGFIAQVALMPDQNLGVVALSNSGSNTIPQAVSSMVFDRFLGAERVNWSERSRTMMEKAMAAMRQSAEEGLKHRIEGTQPSHDLQAYTGQFENPGYGPLSVQLNGDTLEITYNGATYPLTHFHYDQFQFTFEAFEVRLVATFNTGIKGGIDSLSIPLEPMVDPILFKRAADPAMTGREFLEQFVGAYEVMGLTASVSLKGESTLVVSLPGQPDAELEGLQGTTFAVKGMPGFSIEFKQNDAGQVTEAVLTQPNGSFTAPKKEAEAL